MLLMLATAIKLVFFFFTSVAIFWRNENKGSIADRQSFSNRPAPSSKSAPLPCSEMKDPCMHACMWGVQIPSLIRPSCCLSVNLVILLRLPKNPAWTFLGASCRPVVCLFFSISWTVFFFFLQTEEEYTLIFLLENKRREERRWMKPPIQGLWRGAIRIRWVQIWRVVYLPDQIHGTRRGIIPVTSKKSSLSAEGKRLSCSTTLGASFWEGKTRRSTKAHKQSKGDFFLLFLFSPGSPSPLSPLLRPTPSILLGLLYASMPRRLKHS